MKHDSIPRRRPKLPKATISDAAALLLMALAVRLTWTTLGAWDAVDGKDYLSLAKNIAINHVFSLDSGNGPFLPTAQRPPLYPTLIALLWLGDSAPVSAVLCLQAVIGAFTVVVLYFIARDSFNRKIALFAAGGMVLAPMTCLFTASILSETVFTFLLAVGFLLWGRKRFVWAGLVFGFGMLTRPVLLPFLVVLPAIAVLPPWRSQLRPYVIMVAAALAVSIPWVARNAVLVGDYVPIASSGWGTNLLAGTMETTMDGRVWTGNEWVALNLDTNPVTRVDAKLDDSDKDRLRLNRALRRIASDPVHWLVVRAKQYPKLFIDNGDYMLGSYNLPLREVIREPRPLVVLTKVVFISGNLIVLALAALGVFVERARFVSLSHLTLFPIFLLAVHLPMWIEPRYLLPSMPLIALLAAVGAMWIMKNISAMIKMRAIIALR